MENITPSHSPSYSPHPAEFGGNSKLRQILKYFAVSLLGVLPIISGCSTPKAPSSDFPPDNVVAQRTYGGTGIPTTTFEEHDDGSFWINGEEVSEEEYTERKGEFEEAVGDRIDEAQNETREEIMQRMKEMMDELR